MPPRLMIYSCHFTLLSRRDKSWIWKSWRLVRCNTSLKSSATSLLTFRLKTMLPMVTDDATRMIIDPRTINMIFHHIAVLLFQIISMASPKL